MALFVLPYKAGSESVKNLKEALKIKSIKLENSKFKGSDKKTVLNWGNSPVNTPLEVLKCRILNHPEAVSKAVNKLTTFKLLKDAGVTIPEFSDTKEEASKWLAAGKTVVVREVLNGYGGNGIKLIENPAEIPDAPLYTQYIPKTEEYRVHVFKNEAFFIQRKARKKEIADDKINWKVRNLAGGFIFANQDVQVAEACQQEAIKAVQALGLDFGAVDIIWNKNRNKYYVLEINTAPGLTGTTLEKYAEKFKEYQ